jgi:hypothetical protein
MFAADIARSSETGNHEWQVNVQTRPGNENIILSWDTPGAANGFFYLHDAKSDITIDMARTNTYALSLFPGETRRVLSVKASSLADMRFLSMPTAWSISKSAPNPFKKAAIITFSIPGSTADIRPRPIGIFVFDVMGRRVRTLVNGTRYPGIHSVIWDGTDDRQRRLRRGMYIVHCRADGFSGSVKAHLIE